MTLLRACPPKAHTVPYLPLTGTAGEVVIVTAFHMVLLFPLYRWGN